MAEKFTMFYLTRNWNRSSPFFVFTPRRKNTYYTIIFQSQLFKSLTFTGKAARQIGFGKKGIDFGVDQLEKPTFFAPRFFSPEKIIQLLDDFT